MVLRKSFYIRWSAGRSPRVHEVNPGQDPSSRDGGFRRFLVKWHGRPDSDATWIQEDDLRHLDSSLLDCYLSFHSSESSSFQPGGNDGAWSRPLYRPKRDRKPKSNEGFYYY